MNVQRMLATAVLICACRRPEIPELPAAELGRLSPGVAQAIGASHQNAKMNRTQPEAVGAYCMTLQAHGNSDLARRCFRIAVQLAPKQLKWQYYLAVVTADAGDLNQAIPELQRTLEIAPGYVPARLRHADALRASGRTAESLTAYRSLTGDLPQRAEAWYGLGRSLAAIGARPEALAAFERACELFPPYAAAHFAAEQVYRSTGNADRAERHAAMRRASRQMAPPPDDPLLDEVLALNAGAQLHIERSGALEAAGRLPEAVAATEEALRIEPSSVQAHANLVSLYGRLRRFQEADTHYWRAVAIDPGHAEANYNYGVLLLDQGRMEDAARFFRRAIESNPRYADAHNNLGFLLDRAGHGKQALKHFQAAIEANPGHRGARYHAGRMLIGLGRASEAIQHFVEALEPVDEGSVDVMYGLATAYIRSGDTDAGRTWVQKAYDLAVRYKRHDLVRRLRGDLNTIG